MRIRAAFVLAAVLILGLCMPPGMAAAASPAKVTIDQLDPFFLVGDPVLSIAGFTGPVKSATDAPITTATSIYMQQVGPTSMDDITGASTGIYIIPGAFPKWSRTSMGPLNSTRWTSSRHEYWEGSRGSNYYSCDLLVAPHVVAHGGVIISLANAATAAKQASRIACRLAGEQKRVLLRSGVNF